MRKDRIYELLEMAERHHRAGRSRRAVSFYRKVLCIARDDESEWELAHARLGLLHLSRDEISKAVPHLSRAHILAPDEHAYALWLGDALRRLGQPLLASSVLIGICNSPICGADALLSLARATADLGFRDTARRMVSLVPESTLRSEDFKTTLMYCQDA